MNIALTVLCRVIRRRMRQGEMLDTILADYPKLTAEEQAVVKKALGA